MTQAKAALEAEKAEEWAAQDAADAVRAWAVAARACPPTHSPAMHAHRFDLSSRCAHNRQAKIAEGTAKAMAMRDEKAQKKFAKEEAKAEPEVVAKAAPEPEPEAAAEPKAAAEPEPEAAAVMPALAGLTMLKPEVLLGKAGPRLGSSNQLPELLPSELLPYLGSFYLFRQPIEPSAISAPPASSRPPDSTARHGQGAVALPCLALPNLTVPCLTLPCLTDRTLP